MYEYGDENALEWEGAPDIVVNGIPEHEVADIDSRPLSALPDGELYADKMRSLSRNGFRASSRASQRPFSRTSARDSVIEKRPYETAGGIEDWEDVKAQDVDRYGFIIPRSTVLPRDSSDMSLTPTSPPHPGMHRIATALLNVSEAPRRKRGLGRSPSAMSNLSRTSNRIPSRQSMPRDLATSAFSLRRGTRTSHLPGHSNTVRFRPNRTPRLRLRRVLYRASDMLTLPPGYGDAATHWEGSPKVAAALRKRERNREAKWEKMAKMIVKPGGGGMDSTFNTSHPKVIGRTWKGIPDRWRSSAWYAFLASSVSRYNQQHRDKPLESDEELGALFYTFQEESSADDAQIDVDVPRTVSSHIMFRRRYRGGQRLLFRVLHAMSLFYEEQGYVQGMASLAATLLCYFDEERAFICLVRLWQVRGLGDLYAAGFEGLMNALNAFDSEWLKDKDVGAHLNELGITPTAYGTRWYLTLFNYSIPFPAQLRVWDAFMLLGDVQQSEKLGPSLPSSGCLDFVHATSAALIDGMREVLLDSDFETAMKILTGWIPIRDEDLFMKVVRTEWTMKKKMKSS